MFNKSIQLNNRWFSTYLPLEDSLILKPDKNYLFDLSYLNCLDVSGAQSVTFLQGQLTCNVTSVHQHQMREGALCTLKGRVLTLMDIVDWHGLHLILPEDLIIITQKTLEKAALFSRVRLQASTHNYLIYGFYLQNDHDLIPEGIELPKTPLGVTQDEHSCCYALNKNLFIIIRQASQPPIHTVWEKHDQWRGSLAWHKLQLEQYRFEIYPETSGLFLPHRLGLQHSGHVDFEKGCYKGQEIIARTQFRAKIKHELHSYIIQTNEPLYSGKTITATEQNKEIGVLVDFCPISNQTYLISASILIDHPSEVLIEGHEKPVRLKQMTSV